jgi:hypothetical protein
LESIEEKLKESPPLVNITEVPEKFIGWVTEARWDEDENERECLYLKICVEDLSMAFVTQKFTSFHLPYLVQAMKKLGIDNLVDVKCLWVKTPMRIGHARWLPTKIIKKEKGE